MQSHGGTNRAGQVSVGGAADFAGFGQDLSEAVAARSVSEPGAPATVILTDDAAAYARIA